MYNLKTTNIMGKERFVNLWFATCDAIKKTRAFERNNNGINYDEFMEEAEAYLEEEESKNTVSRFLDMVKADLKKEDSSVKNNIVNSSKEVSKEIESKVADSSVKLSEELSGEVETLLNSDVESLKTEEDSIFNLDIKYSEVEDEYNGFKLTSKVIRGKKGFQIAFSF